MKSELKNIEQAEEYIFNYNWYNARTHNQDEELLRLKQCEKLAIQHGQNKLLYKTRAYILGHYTQSNELNKALDIGNTNYEDCKKNEIYKDELLSTLSFLIQLHQILGNYTQSEIYINICKELALELKDTKKLCNINITAANQYYYTNDIEKCTQAHEQSLQYAAQLNDTNILITIYNNYAYHIVNTDTDKCEALLNQGIDLLLSAEKKISKNEFLLGHYYLNYAILFEKKEDNEKTIYNAEKAEKLLQNCNVIDSVLEAKIILSTVYFKQNQYEKCLQYLNEIEQTAIATATNGILLKCYKLFHEFYEQQKDYSNAYTYLKKYIDIKDLTYNQESEKTIRNLQISHEVKTIKIEKENAERTARIKHDFLANMSHEIRTPINSIIGICYLLNQDSLSEKQKNYVDRLEHNGENLLGIINDILDISKIEAGKLQLNIEPNFLSVVLQNIYNQMIFQAEKKNIELKLEMSALPTQKILMDAVRISQIIINLVANAIKFTQQGSVTIAAILKAQTTTDVTIEFKISDTGIGIEKEKLDTIFERFEQAHEKIHAKFGGTGLGLAISKKLIDMMQGSIQVESTIDDGTEFIVQIPFKRNQDEIVEIASTINLNILKDKKILIVDDIEENRLVLKDIIESAASGIKIIEAVDGQDAIKVVEANNDIAIIIMDLDMPKMNGIDATTFLRKKYNHQQLKIIANTASLISISKEDMLQMGFDDFLQKPIRPQKLLETIIEHLSK